MASINLLPWRETRREKADRKIKLCLFMSVIGAIIVLIIMKIYAMSLHYNQTYRNDKLNHEILKLDQQKKMIEKLNLSHVSLFNKVRFFHKIEADMMVSMQLINQLYELVPSGIVLDGIERNLDKVTLFGRDESSLFIQQLMRNISNDYDIKSFEIIPVNKMPSQEDHVGRSFKLVFTLSESKL